MRLGYIILFCILFAGCATSYFVLDIIDLPPPQNVRAIRHDGKIIIYWQPGRERRRPLFRGYKLFFARYSLAATPVDELPPPLLLSAAESTFTLASNDTAKLFLHLRSYLDRQRISLPSLPEVIVPGTSAR